jgi:cytochrome c-type biogenesis protein CcmE
MTRKQTRLSLILAALSLLFVAVGLIMFALRDSIVFFYTPSEISQKQVASGTHIRLGGLVENGSLVKGADGQVTFNITDHTKTMPVTYKGLLPDLFREGQGVVAEGVTAPDGSFKADVILAKHDEKYMPKEVVDKLKAQGQCRPE